MTIETLLRDSLLSLVSNRVYPDVAPKGLTLFPRITYQQVGGDAVNFLEPTVPSKKNARYRVSVWSRTREEALSISHAAEDALRVVTALQTTVMTAPVVAFEPATELYGIHQDFSFWG